MCFRVGQKYLTYLFIDNVSTVVIKQILFILLHYIEDMDKSVQYSIARLVCDRLRSFGLYLIIII